MAPDGDYIFCVTEFEIGISQGGKTNGSERYDAVLQLEMQNGHSANIYEVMIDHASTRWKLDTFLKSAGIKLNKGEAYEFRADTASAQNCRFIQAIGLRGWCKVVIEDYTNPKTGTAAKRNKVVTFYTDRAKLPAKPVEMPASAEDSEDLPPF